MFFRSTVYTTKALEDNQALADREFSRIADLFLVRVERLDWRRRQRMSRPSSSHRRLR